MRNTLLVLHIAGAALWLGGGIVTVLVRRAMVRGDSQTALSWLDVEARLGKAFFPTAAVVTLLSGVALVVTVDGHGFGDLFVIVGIGAFLLSAVGNGAFTARIDARAVTEWRQGEAGTARNLLAATTRFHVLDNAVLVLALIAMVVGSGD